MSTADMALLFQGIQRAGVPRSALRIVLLPGEALMLPRCRSGLRVLSGTAWVTAGGRDIVLSAGQRMEPARRKDRPLLSGLGTEALLFELL